MSKPTAAKSRPFAHLLGRAATAKKAEEPEKDEKEEAEDETPPANDKEDGAQKAEDDKKEDEAAADDDKDEDDKAEDGEDKEKAELNAGARSSAFNARMRERARCEAIFASEAAAGKVETAAHLAFKTNLTAKEAIGTLASVSAAAPVKTSPLAEAMKLAPNPKHVGADGAAAGETSLAQRIVNAGKKRRNETV